MQTMKIGEAMCEHWNGSKEPVHIHHGTTSRGIGYCLGDPVIVSGGCVQPAARGKEKWMWGDGTGRYFTVAWNEWVEISPGFNPGSGWKLY